MLQPFEVGWSAVEHHGFHQPSVPMELKEDGAGGQQQ